MDVSSGRVRSGTKYVEMGGGRIILQRGGGNRVGKLIHGKEKGPADLG